MSGVNTIFVGRGQQALTESVDSINGLTGDVDITSPDGSITIAVDGQDIELNVATSPAVPYAKLSDVKPTGTSGGTFTSGAYRTRELNTEYDPSGIVSLGANQFTLAAGTYRIKAQCPAYLITLHISRLFNVTDAVEESNCLGTSERSISTAVGNKSFIDGEFEVVGTKVFEIQHVCSTTSTSANGFGIAANLQSQTELYTVVEIWKVG